MCVLVVLFLKLFSWQPKNKPILFAANGALLCISTAALFSYPLQVPATLFFFILCLGIHLYYSWSFKPIRNQRYFRTAVYILSTCCIFAGIAYSLLVYQFNLRSKLAFELNRDGFKEKADSIFKTLMLYPYADYNTHYNYAYLLYFKNDLTNALQQINKGLNLAYSAQAVKLKADILWELNKINEAGAFYKQAVYITPNRMFPKFNLLQFYIKTKQLKEAMYWANDILLMPVKIPSTTTTNIQRQVTDILKNLRRK
jgi:tetratricopeptide (TPR) repeat protein